MRSDETLFKKQLGELLELILPWYQWDTDLAPFVVMGAIVPHDKPLGIH